MMGGTAAGHPWGHYLTWRFKVEDPRSPITAHLDPKGFAVKDALYQFDPVLTNRGNIRPLVSMDMSDPVTAKDDNGNPRGFRTDGFNPVVWIRAEGKGRVFVNCFGNNNEIFWDASMLKLNLAGIQYALGDLTADDSVGALPAAPAPQKNAEVQPEPAAATKGLMASWWNNNSFTGEPVLTQVVSQLNPIVDGTTAPFPQSMPPLGPEFVCARFTGKLVCHHGGYLIETGMIFGNHNRGVACLDLKTGEKKWFDPGVGKCSITFADGMLYLFSEVDGAVALAPASPDGFKITGKFAVEGEGPSWAHPVVTGGRLYLRYDTHLYCYDVKAKGAPKD